MCVCGGGGGGAPQDKGLKRAVLCAASGGEYERGVPLNGGVRIFLKKLICLRMHFKPS